MRNDFGKGRKRIRFGFRLARNPGFRAMSGNQQQSKFWRFGYLKMKLEGVFYDAPAALLAEIEESQSVQSVFRMDNSDIVCISNLILGCGSRVVANII
jgi:hypothetical protein